MGLLSPRVVEAIKKGVSAIRNPAYTRADSDLAEGLTEGWTAGNEQLARIMKGKHPDSDEMPLVRGGRYWEWGGVTGPMYRALPHTEKKPTSVSLRGAVPGSYFYHSHPLTTKDIPGATLSTQDLSVAMKRGLGGVSSLDAEGGLGLAVVNPEAAKLMGRWDGVAQVTPGPTDSLPSFMQTLKDELAPTYGLKGISGEEFLSAMGKPHPTLKKMRGPFPWPDIEPTSEGIGRALQNTGFLDHYSYTAPTAAAEAKRASVLGKFIANAEDVATDRLSKMLKERGFSDGKISAILAAAVSSGSVGSLLAHLQREEATKSEIA